jgi:RNA polymerase sigma-70 factor (ECF subfamily)
MAGVVPADEQRRAAFELLFRAHYRSVENFVTSRYGSTDCDAVLSRTFEVAWRRLEDIPSDATRGWLISVARNCARNELRGNRRRRERFDEMTAAVGQRPETAPPPISAGTLDTFRHAFSKLSPADREVLLLADWDGLVGADLAAALGVSKSTAAVRLHRARTRLRTTFIAQEELS